MSTDWQAVSPMTCEHVAALLTRLFHTCQHGAPSCSGVCGALRKSVHLRSSWCESEWADLLLGVRDF